MTCRRLSRAASAVAAALACAATAIPAYAGQAPGQDPDGFSPITQSVVAEPWAVKGSDGRYHLVYEVQLQNATGR